MRLDIPFTLRLRYFIYGALYKLRRNISASHDKRFFALYNDVTKSGRLTMNLPELYNIYRLVQQRSHIPGNIAELGVYRGASAKILAETKGEKQLYLFDTFAGLPDIDRIKDTTNVSSALTKTGQKSHTLHPGKLCAQYEDVKAYLASYENIHFHVGVFPETTKNLNNCLFSFVHMDADLYSSTLSGLAFFYPRLSPGGILISHDYGTVSCPGVKKAFDEFMADKPELLIELWDTQVMLIKER